MKEAIECIAETFAPYIYIINKKKIKEKNNMFKFNKIVKPDSDMMKLAEEVENFKAEIASLKEDFEKIKRIVKYAKDDQTTCHLVSERVLSCGSFYEVKWSFAHKLYIYVDGEEYIVKLKELEDECADKTSFDFSVSRNLAYFDVSTFDRFGNYTRYSFTIDYEKGEYVVSSRFDEERTEANKANKKED